MGQTKLCHHPPPSTTTLHQPKYIYHHSPPATDSQNLFNKKPIYRNLQPLSDGNAGNLNSRPATAKKRFFTWPSKLVLLNTPEMVLKSCSVNQCLYDAKLQPWTKLVETKVENPVNSRNDSIFEIPNSPPYPPISMLTLAKFCCQKPKTLPTTLTWGERGFFTERQIFYFVSTVLSKIVAQF